MVRRSIAPCCCLQPDLTAIEVTHSLARSALYTRETGRTRWRARAILEGSLDTRVPTNKCCQENVWFQVCGTLRVNSARPGPNHRSAGSRELRSWQRQSSSRRALLPLLRSWVHGPGCQRSRSSRLLKGKRGVGRGFASISSHWPSTCSKRTVQALTWLGSSVSRVARRQVIVNWAVADPSS